MTKFVEASEKLQQHDWYHMMSDSHGVWSDGNSELKKLEEWFKETFGWKGARIVWDKLNAERLGVPVEDLDFPYKYTGGKVYDKSKYQEVVL